MLQNYCKELTVSAVVLACAASLIYGYYTTIIALRDTLQPAIITEEQTREDYSTNTILTSPQREKLEQILTHFNKEVFVGKEPSFVPSSQLLEDKKTLDCSKSYVYFEMENGFAKYEYYHPGKLKRQKIIGSTCWTIEYKLQFPSGFKAIFNGDGEQQDFETTCYGKTGFNLQKQVVIWPECE